MRGSLERARSELAERLRERWPEIEQTALTRVYAVSNPAETADPEYMEGLKAAVFAALDYGVAALEGSEGSSPPIPTVLLAQARLAARNRVSLDTVLRRYFAGYTLLGDFVIEEADRAGLSGGVALKGLLRVQAQIFDRLVGVVTEEFNREAAPPFPSSGHRRAERVDRLLRGDLIDTAEFAYDFELTHVGVIAVGLRAESVMRELTGKLACRILSVNRDDGAIWAWLGTRQAPDLDELRLLLPSSGSAPLAFAFGEPADGINGWRLTHRQAKAALPLALRREGSAVRYADVAILATVLQDDLLTTSLWNRYLEPLADDRDGGELARRTLRAYLDAGRQRLLGGCRSGPQQASSGRPPTHDRRAAWPNGR